MAEDEGIKNTPVTAAGTIELLPCPICCRHWPCACAEDMVEEELRREYPNGLPHENLDSIDRILEEDNDGA